MGPLILIALGVLFLMSNFFPERFSFGQMWPIILIVIGAVKIAESLQKKDGGPPPENPAGKANP